MSSSLLNSPIVNYDSITINETKVEIGSNCKASYNPPYNRIDITMTPTNCGLSHYEVRVTDVDDFTDIGVGNLVYWNMSMNANQSHSFSIDITPTNFPMSAGQTSKTFRICLYAKSEIDGSWDVEYMLFTLDCQLLTSDGDALCVLTTREAPKN